MALYRRKRYRPGDHALLRLNDLGRPGQRCQLCDRGRLEKLLGRQPEPGLPSSGYHLNAEDRVPTQFEEVVVDAYLINA